MSGVMHHTLNTLYPTDLCRNITCLNGGYCVKPEAICQCQSGFNGSRCEIDIDFCPSRPDSCLNSGTCVEGIGNITSCNCSSYFTGDHCENASKHRWICTYRILHSHCMTKINGDESQFSPQPALKNWMYQFFQAASSTSTTGISQMQALVEHSHAPMTVSCWPELLRGWCLYDTACLGRREEESGRILTSVAVC